jgi:hypothetical protein
VRHSWGARTDHTPGRDGPRRRGRHRDADLGLGWSRRGNDHRISDPGRNDALWDRNRAGREDLVRRQRQPCRWAFRRADGDKRGHLEFGRRPAPVIQIGLGDDAGPGREHVVGAGRADRQDARRGVAHERNHRIQLRQRHGRLRIDRPRPRRPALVRMEHTGRRDHDHGNGHGLRNEFEHLRLRSHGRRRRKALVRRGEQDRPHGHRREHGRGKRIPAGTRREPDQWAGARPRRQHLVQPRSAGRGRTDHSGRDDHDLPDADAQQPAVRPRGRTGQTDLVRREQRKCDRHDPNDRDVRSRHRRVPAHLQQHQPSLHDRGARWADVVQRVQPRRARRDHDQRGAQRSAFRRRNTPRLSAPEAKRRSALHRSALHRSVLRPWG